MQFKVSIHCGPVNTFQFEDADNKKDLLNHYLDTIATAQAACGLLQFGDLLINVNQITFVVVEEVQEVKAVEEPVTLEA